MGGGAVTHDVRSTCWRWALGRRAGRSSRQELSLTVQPEQRHIRPGLGHLSTTSPGACASHSPASRSVRLLDMSRRVDGWALSTALPWAVVSAECRGSLGSLHLFSMVLPPLTAAGSTQHAQQSTQVMALSSRESGENILGPE